MHQGGLRFQAVVSSMTNSGKMVAQVVLRFGEDEVPLAPVGPHVLDVSVFRLPPCKPDKALLAVLNQYGKSLQVRHAAYKDHPNIKNGTRLVRMEIAKPVPNFIGFRSHQVMLDNSYEKYVSAVDKRDTSVPVVRPRSVPAATF
ncbi:unnamed protein product [Ixodes pacificus]